MKKAGKRTTIAASLAALLLAATSALAQTDATRFEELEAKTAAIAEELASLRAELDKAKQVGSADDLQILRSEVINATQTAQRAEKSANEWKNTTAVTHLAGYAAAGYTDQKNGTGSLAHRSRTFSFRVQRKGDAESKR